MSMEEDDAWERANAMSVCPAIKHSVSGPNQYQKILYTMSSLHIRRFGQYPTSDTHVF